LILKICGQEPEAGNPGPGPSFSNSSQLHNGDIASKILEHLFPRFAQELLNPIRYEFRHRDWHAEDISVPDGEIRFHEQPDIINILFLAVNRLPDRLHCGALEEFREPFVICEPFLSDKSQVLLA
jgi:hypothetical protein